ncbi:MAG: transcriptional regulator [Paludibacteraceae bacterium]|nr:transcriptional regulator [Paludibacteraceae bacterium]
MKPGDVVLISPEVTMLKEWVRGKVIEVEANPFVGTVISAQTPNGDIYFNKESLFKEAV